MIPLIALLLAAAAGAAAVFLRRCAVKRRLLEEIRPAKARRKRIRERMIPGVDEALCGAGIRIDSGSFVSVWLSCVALAAAAGIFTRMPGAAAVLLTSSVCALPCVFIYVKRKARIRKFESQLADAVTVLSSALRTGYSFQGALKSMCSSSPSPLRDEFEIVSYETSMGMPLEESLSNLQKRVPGEDIRMLCTAVNVQSSAGGDLTEVLTSLSATIRSRAKVRREIRSKTAGGRLSGLIVALLPFALFLALKLISPGYIDPFLASGPGKAAIAAGGLFMLAGFLLIRKIVNVKY